MTRSPLVFHRGHVAFVHDIVMAAVSFVASLYLRLGGALPEYVEPLFVMQGTVLFTMVAAAVFWSQKMYRGIWRYASLRDLVTITRAVTLVILVFLPVMFLLTRLEALPRSVLLINWFVLMALLGGPRFLYRLFKDRTLDLRLERQGRRLIPVLLAGAGDEADLFIRAVQRNPEAEYRVVGLLSEKTGRVGRGIHGVPVLGTIADIATVVERLGGADDRPQRLVLSRPFEGAVVRDLLEAADGLGMTLARLPRLTDFKHGVADRVEVQPVAIEDLLGRPQAVLDREAMGRLIAGRRVLVTGAGGTIGGELVRQISDFGPSRIALFENSEFNLYSIDMELGQRHPDLPRAALVGDVRDASRVSRVMADEKPELVFHAAALKHVPMVEANPFEGVRTNVFGTRIVADACQTNGVLAMVLISTDKAVNPTSVMGATKRIAEKYCQALDAPDSGPRTGTRFVTVRFGNVLGSTGSVVPLFQKQLAAGGPLTVTHPDIKRYFMTVREAVELVLQASALGASDDSYRGRIFVLDMGEPVAIVDLARQMIRLAGLRPDVDIPITFTGLRPGEKLFEEIFHGAEPPVPTGCGGILVAAARATDLAFLSGRLGACAETCRTYDGARIRSLIRELVPEFMGEE
ncbi:MAG: polysaccharide biosynthesis protein [Alphaproteobacteria bacterium]